MGFRNKMKLTKLLKKKKKPTTHYFHLHRDMFRILSNLNFFSIYPIKEASQQNTKPSFLSHFPPLWTGTESEETTYSLGTLLPSI